VVLDVSAKERGVSVTIISHKRAFDHFTDSTLFFAGKFDVARLLGLRGDRNAQNK
jgi:hypothetical protein